MVNNKVLIPASSSFRQTKSFENLEYSSTFKVYIFIYCLYQIRTIQLFRWEEIEEDKYLIYYTHREKQKNLNCWQTSFQGMSNRIPEIWKIQLNIWVLGYIGTLVWSKQVENGTKFFILTLTQAAFYVISDRVIIIKFYITQTGTKILLNCKNIFKDINLDKLLPWTG